MSDDLVEFVRAAITRAEQAALAANEVDAAPWRIDPSDGRIVGYGTFTVVHIEDGTPEPVTAAHIARHDPARVLAEVESKRAILERCERAIAEMGIWGEDGQEDVARDVLRLLAQPYAGEDGWQEEWRL